MKKLYILEACVVIMIDPISRISAQPTLTSTNISPQPGEVFVAQMAQPPSAQVMAATGANITWDFSGVTINSGGTIYNTFSPGMTQFGPLYPNATVACQLPDYVASLIYMRDNSDELIELGINNFVWDNPRTILELPITYQGSFSDTGSYVASGINWIWQISGFADGYGTLILPFGTVYNVLRILENVNRFSGFGWITEYSYSWYQPGTHTPVCRYWTDNMDELFYFRQPSTTGLENAATDVIFSSYPSPFSDQLHINLTNEISGYAQIYLFDLNGKLLYEDNMDAINQKSFTINTKVLLQGMYILKIHSDEAVYHSRIVKQ